MTNMAASNRHSLRGSDGWVEGASGVGSTRCEMVEEADPAGWDKVDG
jgi:hypothetical protein